MKQAPPPRLAWRKLLTSLAYELLDAHHDTIELAEAVPDTHWQAHLDYLRALQRKGRELLAQADAGSPFPPGGVDR